MTFDARGWFCSCYREPHTPECDSDAATARQIYDAGLLRAAELASERAVRLRTAGEPYAAGQLDQVITAVLKERRPAHPFAPATTQKGDPTP